MAKTKNAPMKAPQEQEQEYNENLHTFILNLGDELNIVVAFDIGTWTVTGKVNRYGIPYTFSANIKEEA